jgi:hypothetical protein
MFQNKQTEFEAVSKRAEILGRAGLDPSHGMRLAKLADSAERSLYWLIPAAALAYLLLRILPLLGS